MKAIIALSVLLLAQAALADTPTALHSIAPKVSPGAISVQPPSPDCVKAQNDLAAAQAEMVKAAADRSKAEADLTAAQKETGSNNSKALADVDAAEIEIKAAREADTKAHNDYQAAVAEGHKGHC